MHFQVMFHTGKYALNAEMEWTASFLLARISDCILHVALRINLVFKFYLLFLNWQVFMIKVRKMTFLRENLSGKSDSGQAPFQYSSCKPDATSAARP